MNDSEFLDLADQVLDRIQNALDDAGIGEPALNEGVLEIEFDDGAKVIVNRHLPNREIWVAARSGGFHYRYDGARWLDTRSGDELFASLAVLVRLHSGEPFDFS